MMFQNGLDLGDGGPRLPDFRFVNDILLFVGSAERFQHVCEVICLMLRVLPCNLLWKSLKHLPRV